MKYGTHLLISLFILLISCKQVIKVSEDRLSNIDSLTTDTQKRMFLEEIYEQDQKIRTDRSEVELQHGYDSKELKQVYTNMVETDKLNLRKIERYLKKHGHPTIQNHGELACRTPFIVVHHSERIEDRQRNFKYLYTAYKNGDLAPGGFSLYLGRLYRMKFGKRFTLPNPYREKNMIDSLITRLDLNSQIEALIAISYMVKISIV